MIAILLTSVREVSECHLPWLVPARTTMRWSSCPPKDAALKEAETAGMPHAIGIGTASDCRENAATTI